MVNVYACLLGKWERLNDDPDCTVGENGQSPLIWWEEGAEIYAKSHNKPKEENTLYELDYVHIFFKGKAYRINPVLIQIVED